MARELTVIKSTGDEEKFSEEKYKRSLRRSGASSDTINKVLNEVKKKFRGRATTKELYSYTSGLLKKIERPVVGHYNLKKALFAFGPSGYPFEQFMGRVFEAMGYKVEVSKSIMGRCVEHEVDILATKDGKHTLVECKFHNSQGIYSSVKIPLYVNSRFDDLNQCKGKRACHFNDGYVVTNTRFSSDALTYGKCVNLNLLSWDYPAKRALRDIIDNLGLHPVTCLTKLSKSDAKKLLENNIVTCKDLLGGEKTLKRLKLKPEKIQSLLDEAEGICRLIK